MKNPASNLMKSMDKYLTLLTLIFVMGSLEAKAVSNSQSKSSSEIQVKILRRIGPDNFADVNQFKISEESGVRYCGNDYVPKHAVSLPWLKDLRKPAGAMKGSENPPRSCRSVLKWDSVNYCLDMHRKKTQIYDLALRCTEF